MAIVIRNKNEIELLSQASKIVAITLDYAKTIIGEGMSLLELDKAIENKIVAIGITDYFMIDGYKRIVTKYLQNPDKMKELFPEDDIRSQIEKIFVFPNIELRLRTFAGKEEHAINYHVIFSNTVSIQEIEDNFLGRLEFETDISNSLSLTKDNLKRYGKYH